jgi:hypothetical protein
MILTLMKNRLLIVFCGVLQAIVAGTYLSLLNPEGGSRLGTIRFAGEVAIATGLCAILAGALRSAGGKCWLLVINGAALAALGIIQYGFTRYRISLVTIALLVVVTGLSQGIVEHLVARTRRSNFPPLAGPVSAVFGLLLLALGLRWIPIAPGSHLDLIFLAGYFAFASLCMLGLAVRLRDPAPARA